MLVNQPTPPPLCVFLAVADDTRRPPLQAALEAAGIEVKSAPTPGDATVLGHADACHALVVDLDPCSFKLSDAIGLLGWLRARSERAVHGVALAPHEDEGDVAAALAGGFDAVFGCLAPPEQIAEVVVRLKALRDADTQPPPTD